MWPNAQVISSGRAFEGVLVNELCGRASRVAGPNTCTIPALTGGQAGDVQLLAFTLTTNDTVTLPTPADDGWRPVYTGASGSADYFSNTLTNIGGSNIYVYWRVLTGSAQNFVMTQPAGNLIVSYAQFLLRGVDDRSYLYGMFNGANKTNNANAKWTGNPAFRVRANDGDLILAHQADTAITDVVGAEPPVGGDVLASCRDDATPVHLVLFARHTPRANNLLRYSESLNAAAWTPTNVTVSNNVSISTRREEWRLTPTGSGDARRMVATSVDLVAGRMYRAGVTWRGDLANNVECALTYVRPSDSTEHGVRFDPSSPGNDTLVGTDIGATDHQKYYGMNTGGGLFMTYTEMQFTAPDTGTYEFRMSIGNTTDADLDSATLTTSSIIGGNAVYLCEVTDEYRCSSYVSTEAGEIVLPGESDLLMPPGFIGTDPLGGGGVAALGAMLATLWKNTEETKPLCQWMDLNVLRLTHHDGYSLETSRILQVQTAGVDTWTGLHSSHVVHKYIEDGQRFYAEYTVDAIGTGTDDLGFGAMVGIRTRANNQPTGATAGVTLGNQVGQYAYAMNGTTFLNGVSEGVTVTPLDTGDIVGVGIDLVAGEINWYLNGALERTQTIADQNYQTRMPWMLYAGVQNGDNQAPAHLYTANFRGPFGGRKPSGYIAFDHDNELT